MRFTPRATEIGAVASVLQESGHETPQAMAKEVIKRAVELASHRESWIIAHSWPGGAHGANYGPFWSEAEALKFLGKLREAGGEAWLARTSPPAALGGPKSFPGNCSACGCPAVLHETSGASRARCWAEGCYCEKFEK